jgi:hypothetical protein
VLHCLSLLDTVTLKFLLRTLAITLGEWLAIAAWLVLSLRTLCRRFFLIVLHNVCFISFVFCLIWDNNLIYISYFLSTLFYLFFVRFFWWLSCLLQKRFLEVFLFFTNFHSKTIFRDIWFIANFFYNSKYYLYWLAIHEENSISIFSTSLLLFTCLMYRT